MIDPSSDRWAERLALAAQQLPYPPTPNLSAAVSRRLAEPPTRPAARRWQLVLVGLAVLILTVLAVPAARAAAVRFIQIGVVRIFVGPATATPTPVPAASTNTATPAGPRLPTATPQPASTPTSSLLDSLIGETRLADAQAQAGFHLALPSYPANLGSPDRIFLQEDGAPMVVLVWNDPIQPAQARLALFEIAAGNIGLEKSEFIKGVPPDLQNTTVLGQPAAWTTGPYLLTLKNGDKNFYRLIEGHVLIWVENDITYRLELGPDATMAEAVKIAESLQ